MTKKIHIPFYFKKPVGTKFRNFEFRKVDHDKHPLLFMFLAGNFENIIKDVSEYYQQKLEGKIALFPTYYSKKEIFEQMMEQAGVRAGELNVCYEVPNQPLCILKAKTDASDNKQQV